MVLCTFPCTLVTQLMPVPANTPQAGNVMMSTPFLRGYTMASMLIGVAMAVWELAAGIGLVKSRPWGRSLSLGYGYISILMAVATTAIGILYIAPAMQQAAQGIPDPVVKKMMGYMPVLFFLGACTSLIYPVLLIIFMNRPNVRAYFDYIRGGGQPNAPLHPTEDHMAYQSYQQGAPIPPQPMMPPPVAPPPPGSQPTATNEPPPAWSPPSGSPPPPKTIPPPEPPTTDTSWSDDSGDDGGGDD